MTMGMATGRVTPKSARLNVRARRRAGRLLVEPKAGLRVLAVLAAGAVTCLIAFQVSAVGILRSDMPEAALRVAPTDAEARANLAVRVAEGGQSPASLDRARALAYDAIRRDPLQVTAFRALAVADQRSHGNVAQIYRLLGFAQRLSRRDQATQLWLIQDLLRRGRIAEAIQHFDIAIRSAGESRDSLFQVLIFASGDPRILPPLRSLVARRPDWWLPFLDMLARSGPDIRSAAALAQGMLRPSRPEEQEVLKTLVTRSADAREYELAWSIYRAASGPAANRAGNEVWGGDFERTSAFPPFEWWYAQEPNLWAAREAGANSGNVVRLFSQNDAGGDVLRQVVHLQPGRYQLRMLAGEVPADVFSRPSIVISCAAEANGLPFATGKPNEGRQGHAFELAFTVPEGCAWQWVRVTLAGQNRDPATAPWLDNISIRREQ